MAILKNYFNYLDIDSKELFKGGFYSLFIRLLSVFTSYLFTFLIAKLYGSSSLGLFTLGQTFLLIFSIFARLGFDTASVKLISENLSKKYYRNVKNIYYKIIVIVIINSTILSIILYFSSKNIALMMNKIEMIEIFKSISFGILPFSLLLIHSESFRGMKKIILYALFRNMSIPFISSFILLLLYNNNLTSDLIPVYSFLISIYILSFIVLLLWIFTLNKLPDSNQYSTIYTSSLFNVSLPMLLTSSMNYFLNWIGILILGFYVTDSQIGVYNVAMKVSLITSISLFAINSIAAPKFSELHSTENFKDFKKVVRKSSKLIFWLSAPILFIIIIFSNNILNIFGSEFSIGKTALILLSIGQFFNSCSGSVGYILQMTGKQKSFQNIMFLSTFINIILNLILIPKYGIEGAAFSSSVSIFLWNFLSILLIKKEYNILTFYIPFINKIRF